MCSLSSAHRRFQEWRDAGVFERFWQNGLLASDQITAGRLKKTGENRTDRGETGRKAQSDD
ncbi:hypothetical protein AB6G73_19340 [Providencia vermicola]